MASKRLVGSDQYAYAVAKDLILRHRFGKTRAINAVQGDEAYVRKAYAADLPPAYVAKRIALGRSSGQKKARRTGYAAGQTGLASLTGRATGRTAGRSEGCIPSAGWIPPVYVDPEVYALLDHHAHEPAAPHPHGHIFGKRGGHPMHLQPGVLRNKAGTSWTRGGALYVSASSNSKTGAVDVTWVSIKHTCVDCKLQEEGVCYADKGHGTQFTVRRMERQAGDESATEVAVDEAACIDSAYDGGPVPAGRVLRVHGSGDTSTREGAHALGAAIGRWKHRGGAVAYTYTHAWRRVRREDFGPHVSVLASLDNLEDARAAMSAGYGAVTGVFVHDEWAQNWVITKGGSFVFKIFQSPRSGTNLKWLPCPAQYPHDSVRDGQLVPGDAARWKKLLVGTRLGLSAQKIAKYKTDDIAHIMRTIDAEDPTALNKLGLPSPSKNPEAFHHLFRLIPKTEAATCDSCKQCFSDRNLAASGRAIAFKPDHSGGVQKTQEAIRDRERTKAVVRLAVVQ